MLDNVFESFGKILNEAKIKDKIESLLRFAARHDLGEKDMREFVKAFNDEEDRYIGMKGIVYQEYKGDTSTREELVCKFLVSKGLTPGALKEFLG